jgi:hypothetical protein
VTDGPRKLECPSRNLPFHGACAQEQFGTDLGVGAPRPRELSNLMFLWRQFGARLLAVGAHLLADGLQLAAGRSANALAPIVVNEASVARS